MKQSRVGVLLLSAAVCAGIALSSMSCMGLGGSYGSIRVNISDQPVWGPTGYDRADYYYFPDMDVYYSVSQRQYIYRDGPNWDYGTSLPPRYSSFDPYHSYKVVINNEDRPYQYNDRHRAEYNSYKGKRDQPVIRDSRDAKYFENKDHPEHGKWVKQQNH